jgi:hypothetical protein
MTNIEQLNTRIQTIKTNREKLQSEYKKNAAIIADKRKDIKRIDSALRETDAKIDALVKIPTNTTGARQRTADEQNRLNDYRAARALANGNRTRIEGEITALQTAQTARATEIVRLKAEKKADQGLRNNQEKLGPEKKAPGWKRGWRSFRESVPTKYQAPTLAAAAAILAAGVYYGSQNMPEINNPFNRGKSKPRTERESPRVKETQPEIDKEVEDESTTADYTDGLETTKKEKQKRVGKYDNNDQLENFKEAPAGSLFQNGQVFTVNETGDVKNYEGTLSSDDNMQVNGSKHLKTGLCIRKMKLDNGETNYSICNLDGTPYFGDPNVSPFVN